MLQPLPWESEIVGKRMAAIKYLTGPPAKDRGDVLNALVETATDRARQEGYAFLMSKAHTDDVAAVRTLESQRFFLVDTLLDFEIDLQRLPPASVSPRSLPPEIEIRLARQSDRKGLLDVARNAFAHHFGRFHSDPHLGPEVGVRIYERWIDSCLDGWADWIVVAEVGGRIAGYTAWKAPAPLEVTHQLGLGHYSIGAIHPDLHGRGLFGALTQKGIDLFEGKVARIEGPTHINNYAVQRAYLKQGWRIEDARHAFHRWL